MPRPTKRNRVRLKAANPFDLIRLIARSQSDPRKAVAELVQNSLDAGARHVQITWFTHQKQRALRIADDGAGVFPDMDREEALRRIATTIGHSHKANLDPAERHRQMTLGKYGIGLLGFWSLARVMEIRSRVGDSPLFVLRMEEDRPDAEIVRGGTGRLLLEGTSTEVVLRHVHDGAVAQVKPGRLASYLGQELRGQILDRGVTLEILDRVGRGRAQKRRVVRPVRFAGVPLADLRELPVPGFRPARLDLYLVPAGEERVGRVALSCGGTVVLDDLGAVDGADSPREPWSGGRLEGVVDFGDLAVAPSTRRSFVRDAASTAFLAALLGLEARMIALLEEDEERRRQEEEADDARDLRKMFRRIPSLLPDYALFGVREGHGAGDAPDPVDGRRLAQEGLVAEAGPGDVPVEEPGIEEPDEADPEPRLYPPGALASVEIRPRRSRLAPGGSRGLRAFARDADGRDLLRGTERVVNFAWEIDGPGSIEGEGSIDGEGPRVVYHAAEQPGSAQVMVTAREGDTRVTATALVDVNDEVDAPDHGGGIPDPEPVEAPNEPWRSRVLSGKWQYNVTHRDYRQVRGDRRRRLRYLARLFAKELVLRNFADPTHAPVLERMVEVLTYIGDGMSRRNRSR